MILYLWILKSEYAEQVCSEKKVSLLAYSPLAGGVLSGKYILGSASEKSRLNIFSGFMDRYNKSLARTATEEYLKVCQCPEHTALYVSCVLLGWAAGVV